ncbi:MAG TPA: hypothetical protein VEG35_01135, partial [Burkholderiales bacterium]|nr:hypothetical protein [Burkholderiales bacterium]
MNDTSEHHVRRRIVPVALLSAAVLVLVFLSWPHGAGAKPRTQATRNPQEQIDVARYRDFLDKAFSEE